MLLFTDCVVLAKQKRSTGQLHIIRQLFFLDKITLVKSQSSHSGIVFIYLDEYGLLATTFMLDVNEDERETWIATIERAKVIEFYISVNSVNESGKTDLLHM